MSTQVDVQTRLADLLAHAVRLERDHTNESRARADEIYTEIITLAPESDAAEEARRRRTKFALAGLERASAGQLNMAVVFYIYDAAAKLERVPKDVQRRIGYDLAVMGRKGFDILNSDAKYFLRTPVFGGAHTGLHCVSILFYIVRSMWGERHAAELGCNFEREYKAALQLREAKVAQG